MMSDSETSEYSNSGTENDFSGQEDVPEESDSEWSDFEEDRCGGQFSWFSTARLPAPVTCPDTTEDVIPWIQHWFSLLILFRTL